MATPADDFRHRSHYSVSTDREWRAGGRYRAQSMIWDERHNRYVCDQAGAAITFPTPHDAEQWLERQWAKAHASTPNGRRERPAPLRP
jgi:hypothetical protein